MFYILSMNPIFIKNIFFLGFTSKTIKEVYFGEIPLT